MLRRPLIGSRILDQLDAAVKGAALTLDGAVLDRIDEIVPTGLRPLPGGRRLAAGGADRPGAPPPPADRAAAA